MRKLKNGPLRLYRSLEISFIFRRSIVHSVYDAVGSKLSFFQKNNLQVLYRKDNRYTYEIKKLSFLFDFVGLLKLLIESLEAVET